MRWHRLIIASLYIGAIFLGIGSAWLWLTRVGIAGVDAGAWRVNLLAGSQNADAYTRARIALGAVLALDRSETCTTPRSVTIEANHCALSASTRSRARRLPPAGGASLLTVKTIFFFRMPSVATAWARKPHNSIPPASFL